MAAMETPVYTLDRSQAPREIEIPAATVWPFVLALGANLIFAGLVTGVSVTVLGTALTIVGCFGWARQVLPNPRETAVPVLRDDFTPVTNRPGVDRLPVAPGQLRAWLPLRTHPVSAGLKGGLAGSAAMAIIACGYGLLKAGSVWYPINLLAASVYAQSLELSGSQLHAFHADSFAIAVVIHVIVSTAVGLLYGAMLPMFARRPVILGGLIGPVLWSGLIYSMLSLLNPLLQSHIDWLWFIASQMAFGIVAGLVVVRQPRVPTAENVAFAIRAGVEAPGIVPPHPAAGEQQ